MPNREDNKTAKEVGTHAGAVMKGRWRPEGGSGWWGVGQDLGEQEKHGEQLPGWMSKAGGPGASAGTKEAWTETRLWSWLMTKPRNLDSFHQQGKALRDHSSTFQGSYSLLFTYLSISLLVTPCWKFVTRRNMENGCVRRKKWIWPHMKRGGWKEKQTSGDQWENQRHPLCFHRLYSS